MGVMHVDEPGLVARARAGDEDAFRRLVELHQGRVYRTAYAVVGDHADAAEVAQDTWIKAWRALGDFRGNAAVGTWLTRLAVNAARDYMRRRRALAAADSLLPELPIRPAGDVESVADRDELGRALGGLPSGQRRLLALRHVLALTVSEIARLLGVPPGTVKSRLHAAAAALRSALHEAGAGGRSEQWEGNDPGHLPGAPPVQRPSARPGGTGRPELGQPGRTGRISTAAAAGSGSHTRLVRSLPSERGARRDAPPPTRGGLGRFAVGCRSRCRTAAPRMSLGAVPADAQLQRRAERRARAAVTVGI